MKRMKFVPEVTMTDLKGDAIIAFQGGMPITGPGAPPLTVSHLDFFLGKLADPKVLTKIRKEGMEAVLWTIGCRDELLRQEKKVEKNGWWYLEDDRGDALRDVILNPSTPYSQIFGHSFLPFLESAKNMETVEDVDESKAETNGKRTLRKRTAEA